MCGRYALHAAAEELWAAFGLDAEPTPIEPRYNVAPGQDVLVVGKRAPEAPPRLTAMRWGLLPSWARDPRLAYKCINARVETFDQKPAFRAAAAARRCVVPASGYYEWQKAPDGKHAFYVRPTHGGVTAFAGLWERWRAPGGEVLYTCAVLTCPASGPSAAIHDRMPIALPPEAFDAWLDPRLDAEAVRRAVLDRCPPPDVEVYEVSPRVGSVANEGAENIVPLHPVGPS